MTGIWILFAVGGVLLNVLLVMDPPLAFRLFIGAVIVGVLGCCVSAAHCLGYTAGRQARQDDHADGYVMGHKHGYEQGLREGVRRENAGLVDLFFTHGSGVVRQIEEIEREE